MRSMRASVERAMSAEVRASALVFVVVLVHSLPEGFAIGTAYASDTAGLSLFVIAAIAVQNIPEGTSVAIPMAAAGLLALAHSFWEAVATSAPQPIGAAVAYLLVEEIEPCCRSRSGSRPARCSRSSSSSCSRMPCVAAVSRRRSERSAGGAGMLALSAALGV